jgi:hypothetical protein
MRFDSDQVTFLQSSDARAHFDNLTTELVAWDMREGHEGDRPVQDFDIRRTDGGRFYGNCYQVFA